MSNWTNYVVGFMFSPNYEQVALIRKQRPPWQKGLLNGIGGKMEGDEVGHDAMIREFREETGCETPKTQWKHFASIVQSNYAVQFFVATGNLDGLQSTTDETIVILNVKNVVTMPALSLDNIPWLVLLAIDSNKDNHPSFTTIS